MGDESQPLSERIQLLVDGKLDDADRRALERELEADPDARRQLESMKWLRGVSRETLAETIPPVGLVDGIRERLDREDGERAGVAAGRTRRRSPHIGWMAAAAVLVVAVLTLVATRPWDREAPVATVDTVEEDVRSLAAAVANDMHAYHEGELALEKRSQSGEEIETFFVERGIDFETRVFDLRMMKFDLVGGTPHRLLGSRSAAFAYAGPEGIEILCQMYLGRIADLPPTDDVREHDGIKFYSYKLDCVSMTFWREGDVICVLASMADLEQVVALAFAKAVKV